ncbi:MAG: VWA domain-containing protein, partial [Acidobacteriota bacterium]
MHVGAQDITPTVTDKQGTYTLHISNQAVVLDVVVNDQNGEPKENLTQNDFTVYEGKVPQKILSFERSSPPLSKTNHQPPAIHSTADLDRLEPSAPVTIIALDE